MLTYSEFKIVAERPSFTVVPANLLPPAGETNYVEFYKKLDGSPALRTLANQAAHGSIIVAPRADERLLNVLRTALARALGDPAVPVEDCNAVALGGSYLAVKKENPADLAVAESDDRYDLFYANGALGPLAEAVTLDDARAFASDCKSLAFTKESDGTYHLTERSAKTVAQTAKKRTAAPAKPEEPGM